jgi:hypothetical protein
MPVSASRACGGRDHGFLRSERSGPEWFLRQSLISWAVRFWIWWVMHGCDWNLELLNLLLLGQVFRLLSFIFCLVSGFWGLRRSLAPGQIRVEFHHPPATVAALCERRTLPLDDRDGWTGAM